MKKILLAICLAAVMAASPAGAQTTFIPEAIHYQGQLQEGNLRYEGAGLFRFAIVDGTKPTPYILWSNDGTKIGLLASNVPTAAVSLTVTAGLFEVGLGDASLANMTNIPISVFRDNRITYLRVWFQKTAGGVVELMSPDTQLLSVPYAYRAGAVNGQDIDDDSIPMGKLGRESVGPQHEGRSNTIRSVYFDVTSNTPSRVIYTVPTGKTFVLTDIFITSADNGPIWMITNNTTAQLDQYIQLGIDARLTDSLQNWTYSLKSGIRFVHPNVVAIFPQGISTNMRIRGTIAGFEFDTPQ